MKGLTASSDDPEAASCFEGFEFIIYTAISNMLQDQTAGRVADSQSKVYDGIFDER